MITGNRFSDNRVGMTLLSSYQEAFTPQRSNQVVGNLLTRQRRSGLAGAGRRRLRDGCRDQRRQGNTFARNRIGGNARAGVILTNTEDLPSLGNPFDDDVFEENGVDVANTSAARTPASANCARGG